jgi:hypothetical protein
MRNFAILAALVLSFVSSAFAQETDGMPEVPAVTYPDLPAAAETVAGFVPAGWKLESQAIGDLNNDKRADILFVLRMTDPANVINNEGGLGEQTFDSNPRILAAAFKRDSDFELALANHTLITRRTDPVLDDVLGENGSAEIKGRSIAITLQQFASAGGWDAGNRTLRFRWQKQAFRLIGFDSVNVHRGSGEMTKLSINFLTGDVEESTGSIEDDELKTTKRKIPKRPLLTIDDVGDGMMFAPKL